MSLNDAINSYETAIGALPASRDKLAVRLSESWEVAKKQSVIGFNQYRASNPGGSALRGFLVRVAGGSRELIEKVQEALRRPPADSPHASPPAGLLDLLLTRDEIRRLSAEGPTASATLITRLAELDQRLKEWAKKRRVGADRAAMSRWRNSIQPVAGQWWWYLDDEAKPHALWTLLAGLFFAGSIAVGADTFSILKNVTTSNVTAIGTIAQSVLALLAGSAFTSSGREWLGNAFSAIGIDRRFQGASRMWLAFVVFVMILAGWFLLPVIASSYYIGQGGEYQKSGLLSRSIESYQQAIALKPRQLEARFGLASSLVKAREYDKAIDEYRRITEIDPNQATKVNGLYFDMAVSLDRSREYDRAMALYKRVMEMNEDQFSAANNQARLYIVHRKDPQSALLLLNKLNERVYELSAEDRYYMLKNRGWAMLEIKSAPDAEVWLRKALKTLEGQGKEELGQRCGAGARFLLGKALESQNRLDEALREWDAFARLLQHQDEQASDIEPEWRGYAQAETLRHARAAIQEKETKGNEN